MSLDVAPARSTPAYSRSAWVPKLSKVLTVTRETSDVVSLELEPPSGFTFAPGQFTMLSVFGVGEVPVSISGGSGSLVQTVRAVGAVTSAIASSRPGDVVGIRGPFGSAWPLHLARDTDVLVIAGGLGLAPLRPAVRAILIERDRYARASLLYGSRNPSQLLYQDELATWRARFDIDVEVTVDSAGADWRGNVGVVPSLIEHVPVDPATVVAFVCGPEVMMRFTRAELRARGIADERIFVSIERNMRCAIGLCGHCQLGPMFACKDGPVLRADRVGPWIGIREM